MMKKILSYILPIRFKNYQSTYNGPLELNIVNGKLLLDTLSSNYSYGSLQRILRLGLKTTGVENSVKNILLLGLGAGSVIQTIREEFHSNATIEAVEIDPEIIEIALKDFKINRLKNVNIINADAFEYLMSSQTSYDLIIVDLFIIDTIPREFTSPEFITNLKNHLTNKGKIIYNTLKQTLPSNKLNDIIHSFKDGDHFNVKLLQKVEGSNDLLIIEKLITK
jgi:spermidine synthase